ncbi:MAG TPA: PAS domain-containing protein [Terracidiphilus sp.]|nr:PAS domain-containing protein [Terracidiphilus sp.]
MMATPVIRVFDRALPRYALAVVAVGAAFAIRFPIQHAVGSNLPPFFTFYPAVILTAILAGFGPGLAATGLSVLCADYFLLPPYGRFGVQTASDTLLLSFFLLLGVFISALAEHYRRNLRRLADYEAESRAWVSQKKLEVALESMSEAVLICDADGNYVHFNDAYVRYCRFKNRNECAKNFSDYPKILDVHTSEGATVPVEMWAVPRALRGETGANLEFVLRRKDTQESWIGSYSFAPLRDPRGEIFGAVVVSRDITDQQLAAEKLRASERQLLVMYENMHDVVFYIAVEPGEKFRFISVNPSFLRATGLASDQVVGKLVTEVIPEPAIGEVLEHYRQALRTRKTVSWTETSVYPAGEKHAEVSVSPVLDGNDDCTNLIGVLHDITRRRVAEKRIEQLNRVYSVLSDINQTIVRTKDKQKMLDAVCRIAVEKGKFRMAWIGMVDSETRKLKPVASNGFVDGYPDLIEIDLQPEIKPEGPAAQCIRTGVHAICHDIEHDPIYEPWREAALQRGYRSSGGFPLTVVGKVVGALSLYSSEVGFFTGDELPLLDEMAMDISFALEVDRLEQKRQKSEEELRRRTALFEAQVDSSLDGVLVLDPDGRRILQNESLLEMMKIPKEISGNPDHTVQRQYVATMVRDPAQFLARIDYLNAHPDEISRDEIELLDGTILERYSSPVRDKSHKYHGRIWTYRNITERRKLEENLRQAQKMEALGQLSGGIAHDFNNLLTVILGCSEFIGEKVKDDKRLGRMAEMMAGAARRGAELTQRMLVFARRQNLLPQPVDVNRLLKEIENFLRRALTAQIELELIPSTEECVAIVDPAQLDNALLNLCVNARDAMPRGGKLTIETKCASLDDDFAARNPDVQPGHYIQIAVTDTGTGIRPEHLSRVFDPFFTTKEAGRGTGLGLSMVYGFVKQSKGHIRIYSELGRGTTVNLYLPRSEDPGLQRREDETSLSELHGTESILLVEDDPPVREFAKAQLQSLGYRVLEASNGHEALTVLHEHGDFDLLFTDVVMPAGMNGHELAREAVRFKPGLRVLYCSGFPEGTMLHQGILTEGAELLSKPYSRLELARRIRKVLSSNH